jgi:hypothetical protein
MHRPKSQRQLLAAREPRRKGAKKWSLIEWHAERYIERPPTELVRQRARTAG